MEIKMIYKELKDSYSLDKQRLDYKTGAWGYYVIRPLSFYFSAIFIKFKFSANKVSALGLIILMLSFYYLIKGEFILGAFLTNIWYLSDCIDGNIARFEKKIKNKFGGIFDSVIGMLYYSFIYFCIGLGYFFKTSNILFLILGFLTSILVMLRRCFSLRTLQINSETKKDKNSKIQLVLRWIFELQDIMLLILAPLNGIDFWLYFTFLFNLITTSSSIILKLISLYKEDQY